MRSSLRYDKAAYWKWLHSIESPETFTVLQKEFGFYLPPFFFFLFALQRAMSLLLDQSLWGEGCLMNGQTQTGNILGLSKRLLPGSRLSSPTSLKLLSLPHTFTPWGHSSLQAPGLS